MATMISKMRFRLLQTEWSLSLICFTQLPAYYLIDLATAIKVLATQLLIVIGNLFLIHNYIFILKTNIDTVE